MLVSFTVANFRSIKTPITLSMECKEAQSKNFNANKIIKISDKICLLKNSYIYGANASGKSNLIKAISYMSDFVINSAKEKQSVDNTGVEPFLLDAENENSPSYFQIVFIDQKIKYRYGFKLDKDLVHEEWLYYVPNQRETMLFKRNGDQIEVSNMFEEGKTWEEAIDKFGFTLRKNALFISTLTQLFQGKKEKKMISSLIVEWFATKLEVVPASDINHMMGFTILSLATDNYRNEIDKFVKFADTGIQKIQSDIKVVEEKTEDNVRTIAKLEGNLMSTHIYKDKYGKTTTKNLDFMHHESDGTKKIFALSALLFDAIKNEKTLIVDEFSAQLHPVLSRRIIHFFNQFNLSFNSQLAIVTHDISLLKNDDIEKNQIWLTEKDKYGATKLEQMSNIKGIRKTDILNKKYYEGEYGAIPNHENLNNLTPDSFKDFLNSN
jgi:uncharacterized protein